MTADDVRQLARDCGFELAGVAAALPVPDSDRARYQDWLARGLAGDMQYLAGRRAALRDDPRHLLPEARSIVCVGKLYHTPQPLSTGLTDLERAWISRYAWGDDYHASMRAGLERLRSLIEAKAAQPVRAKICVDTAPLLERSYARLAGLGWIGRNTCLIHQGAGSWFFLGELLVSLEIPPDAPPPDRCGSCRRCIEACPTAAIVPRHGYWEIDSRLCISYLTIELPGAIPAERRAAIAGHVFGCDICQDVCPWNRKAPLTSDPAFAARHFAPPLEKLAALEEADFLGMFRATPVERARYRGFLRNVAVAMGNRRLEKFRAPLQKLADHPDPLVAEHARWALDRLG